MIHEAAIRGRGVGSIGKSNGRDGWYRGIREEEEEAKEKGKREIRDERQEMIYEEKKKKTKQRG